MIHVLLAIDEEAERARRQAEAVVDLELADVTATVLHVFTDNTEGATIGQFGPARRAREVLSAADIDVTLAETSGDPGEEVLAEADEIGADLVSVAGRRSRRRPSRPGSASGRRRRRGRHRSR